MKLRTGMLLTMLGAVGVWTSSTGAAAAATQACARPATGSAILEPKDLYSHDGVLSVTLNYTSSTDADGRMLYCFVTPDGTESPTLHVKPGDVLDIALHNTLPPPTTRWPGMAMDMGPAPCAAAMQDASSVNMHFHGTNTQPACHADEVIRTLVNSGGSYHYHIKFPADEPPGLYWYHPHVHGIAEHAVQGGASGAIVVDGIESVQPAVGGLPTRVLVMRDQTVAGNPMQGGKVPAWDVSLNYVPNAYPKHVPGVISTVPGRKEFWRVVNASADTVADLVLRYDGADQTLGLVALDGVSTGTHDGTQKPGKIVDVRHILIPPAGRAEFIMTTPAASVATAQFVTARIDTGPGGDNDIERTLAVLTTSQSPAAPPLPVTPMPFTSHPSGGELFAGLSAAPITTRRQLYFSEVLSNPSDPNSPTNFYITVKGAKRELFNPANPPNITTTQGAVEEWTIENRTKEVHEFHIHQIHFLVEEQNGVPVPPDQRQFRDTYQIPYWSGTGPYPNVKILMDFRGKVVGDFVYHCHILAHEDGGMMAIIRVLPKG